MTGAIANIGACPLADPDMYTSTGWTALTYDTSNFNTGVRGYKIKGDYVYFNFTTLPKLNAPDSGGFYKVVSVPTNYPPLDAKESYFIVAMSRYGGTVGCNSNFSGIFFSGGLASNAPNYLCIIGWYRYR